jgi:DNA-binding transcriptional LysR family regulator
MNLQHLYYFKSLAILEHYGKAADEQMTSQSSISYAITTLEEELGVPLFYKLGRNIKLTKYGRVFLNYVDDAINSLESGVQEIKYLLQPDLQTVKLGCISSISTDFLPRILSKFNKIGSNRNFYFELKQMSTLEMIENIKNGVISLGIGSKLEEDKDIIFYPLYKEKFVLIVPKNSIYSKHKSINPRDLKNEEFVGFDKDMGISNIVNRIYKDHQIQPNITYRVPTDYMIASFVENDLGISFLPYSEGLHRYEVDIIELEGQQYYREVSFIWMKGYELLPPDKKLRDFMITYFSNNYDKPIS